MTVKNSALLREPITKTDVQTQVHDLYITSLAWFQTHWLQILIAAALGTGIVLGLFWLRSLGAKLARRSATGKGWPAIFGRAIEKTGTFFIVMLTIKLLARYSGAPPQVDSTVNFLFTIATVFQGAIWAREIILGAIEHRTHSEHYAGEALVTAMGLIRVLVTFAVFAIALIVVLDNLGVNVTGLVAGLGVGGIAIGLAAQGIFADLFAALAIIFDRPFRRGDAISYDDTDGSVEAIGLKSTRIRGINGEERIISNKNLLDKEIKNNTKRERRRTKFILGVAYETPVDLLEKFPDTMKQVIEECGFTFIRCGFFQFGGSSLDFEIQYDSMSADFTQSFQGRHHVGLAILRKCNEMDINIPFPIQTTYTAAPDGTMILPYAEAQPVKVVAGDMPSAG